jgi:hypothetical protein
LGKAFGLRYVLAPVLKVKLFENKRRCQDTLFRGIGCSTKGGLITRTQRLISPTTYPSNYTPANIILHSSKANMQ